jgi:hypothetical protein
MMQQNYFVLLFLFCQHIVQSIHTYQPVFVETISKYDTIRKT